MKKLLAILLLATTSLFAQDITGAGTYANPWMIYTPGNLDSMRYHLYQSDATAGYKIFKLANDIDCDGVTFTSGDTLWHGLYIAQQDTFGLDGQGYSIQNLDIKWDTTEHPITWAPTLNNNGFISFYDGHTSYNGGTPYDTVKNITFDNATMIWDSSKSVATILDDYAGILVGYYDENATANEHAVRFENIKIINSRMRYNEAADKISSDQRYGLMFGFIQGESSSAGIGPVIYQCGVENSSLWVFSYRPFNTMDFGGIIGQVDRFNVTLDEVYVKNSSFQESLGAAWYEFSGVQMGALIGYMSGSIGQIVTNAYSYNNTMHTNGIHGGASDPTIVGGAFGFGNGPSQRVYVGAGTYIRDNASPEANSDDLGFFTGYRVTSAGHTENFIDTTGLWNTDWYGVYGEESNTDPIIAISSSEADMQTESHFTDENWDFADVWAQSGIINGGYPYLQWELPGVDLTAPAGGEAFSYPDTLYITWQATSGTDSILIYYSLDNGFSFALAPVDTAVADTFWIPIGLNSSEFMIRITTLDSSSVSTSGAFEYLGAIALEILEPLNVTDIVNDGTYKDSIVVQSILADSVSLYYSVGDTLNWILLVEDIAQPDVVDTVFWYWNPVPQVVGDIYIKAATEVDTSKYGPFNSTTVAIGSQRPSQPQICWTATGSQWSIFRNFELDVSCGWSSPPLVHYSIVIDDYGEGYTTLSTECEQPCGFPVYPSNGSVFLFTGGGDTTETVFKEFYDQKGTTVTYNQRLYYVADSTLYMNDLRNDIDSIALADLSEYYYEVSGVGWLTDPTLSIYNVQWSQIVADTLAVNTDFESYNEPGFTPRLVMSAHGTPQGQVPGVTYDLLSSPPSGEYAQDIALAYSALSYLRYFFRGIHPKIDKDR